MPEAKGASGFRRLRIRHDLKVHNPGPDPYAHSLRSPGTAGKSINSRRSWNGMIIVSRRPRVFMRAQWQNYAPPLNMHRKELVGGDHSTRLGDRDSRACDTTCCRSSRRAWNLARISLVIRVGIAVSS